MSENGEGKIPARARAVVVGGGVAGVSALYHLAKKGWGDSVLLERAELTSGSTWHAAGLLPLFNMSYSVGQVHKYSVRFYQELEKETGLNVGFEKVGNLRLAANQDRMDEFSQYAAVAKTIGVDVRFLTPEEVKELWPLCNPDGLVGAIFHPEDGYIQPADLTTAMAKGARMHGGKIFTQTRVVSFQRKDNSWVVRWARGGESGEIVCEHIVSATGNFARQTGAMVGLELPVIPVEHQYIVTDEIPEVAARRKEGKPEMAVLRGADDSWYMREERGGLLLGPYEKGAPACYVDGPADNCKYELFPEDIERLMPHVESAIRRVPVFEKGGVKQVYNGAICYTPDGNPIIGPAWGVPNFWLSEGHSFGITAAGGAGWQLAEWMVEGEPTIDMLGVEPRRYGDYATKAYLIQKNEEAYANVFTIHYPDEERPAGRPLRTAPCYERMKNLGAVFGQKFGWERANFFASSPEEQKDDWSFRRSRWFKNVEAEVNHTAAHAGLLDMTAFAKCAISGAGARAFLDGVLANKLPSKGRVGLCHALNTRGGVHSEFTVFNNGGDSFYLVSAGALQRLDHDWLQKHLPADGSVRFVNITNQNGVLVLAGPESRKIMQAASPRTNWGNESFKWLTGQRVNIGLAPALAVRVNFVGELGWEIHHPLEYQNHIFDALFDAAKSCGADLKPFGIRAMEAMRIEKSYKMVGQELSIEYAAYESGLQRFVHPDKGDFIGRDALLDWEKRGFNNQLVTMEVGEVKDADALGNNAILRDGKTVGRATSGGYGFRSQKSLAMAMVPPEMAGEGEEFQIDILGRLHPAKIIADSHYDPKNEKLRG